MCCLFVLELYENFSQQYVKICSRQISIKSKNVDATNSRKQLKNIANKTFTRLYLCVNNVIDILKPVNNSKTFLWNCAILVLSPYPKLCCGNSYIARCMNKLYSYHH